ncbi:MAG: EutN/CcmL family microcompartment protein [Isosphaeraceae bacterium]|nr:EutN/CcmL family microcompartment protein [Isosphaeraceae bacterium]
MRIAEVVGRVTFSRVHPSLVGLRHVIVLPMPATALLEGGSERGEDVIAIDPFGVAVGDLVGLSEGREAANPYGKTKTPVDAYCACLIDRLDF